MGIQNLMPLILLCRHLIDYRTFPISTVTNIHKGMWSVCIVFYVYEKREKDNMPICASLRDYHDAFIKHLHAYMNWGNTGSISKSLILVYCVECGLKYLIMYKEGIHRTDQAAEDVQGYLRSHDFQMLLGYLKQGGAYSFHPIRTIHGDTVRPSSYHQLCRYHIHPQKEDQKYVVEYNQQLGQIADWLKEQV